MPQTQGSPFGALLRRWRSNRRLTQEQLADDAEISTRHLSFLEGGKARPSREMVLLLASALELELRDRNLLLGAAGYAPVYRASALEAATEHTLRTAILGADHAGHADGRDGAGADCGVLLPSRRGQRPLPAIAGLRGWGGRERAGA